MRKQRVEYQINGNKHFGWLCEPEGEGIKPAVIVFHAWKGQDAFVKSMAEELAEMGYVAFCADMYGIENPVTDNDQAGKLMIPLFINREELQKRANAAFEYVRDLPSVDSAKIGAIGFCFGGLTVIELFRSGVDLKAAVSFHGVLGNKLHDFQAKPIPIKKGIKGSILILHGHDDPLVSQQDIVNLENEFTAEKVDWQIHIFGNTSHAFTNPDANEPSMGLLYNKRSDVRSRLLMKNFFAEVLSV